MNLLQSLIYSGKKGRSVVFKAGESRREKSIRIRFGASKWWRKTPPSPSMSESSSSSHHHYHRNSRDASKKPFFKLDVKFDLPMYNSESNA